MFLKFLLSSYKHKKAYEIEKKNKSFNFTNTQNTQRFLKRNLKMLTFHEIFEGGNDPSN